MLKTIYAIIGAGLVAGCLIACQGVMSEVEAHGSTVGAKGDRADLRPLASACSEQAWPYFEAGCLRDARNPYGAAREVRMVSTDRLVR